MDPGSRLAGQFVLSAVKDRAPQTWLCDHLDGWFLARHHTLPVVRLIGTANRHVGWMLGYPISEAGVLLGDGEELQLPPEASSEAVEDFIYSFGGRFAVVLLGGDSPRFYLDPCGTLSAVFCAHQRIVASTPNLIPYDEQTRDRVDLANALGIPHTNAMYPFGLTPRYLIDRILPNHFLELSTWQAVRHWPKHPLGEGSIAEAIVEVAEITKRNIAAIVSKTPTYLMLTAGKDSRMLLACSKAHAGRLELVTARIGDDTAAVDCDIARRIAKRFGLNHRVLPTKASTQEDLDEWTYRTSNATGENRGWKTITMYKALAGGHAVLFANANELAWNDTFEWLNSKTPVIRPELLLEACGCPPMEEPMARAAAWVRSLPLAHSLQVWPLWYLEQRLGSWAGVWAYAYCDLGFVVMPACHRRAVERMLTLPLSYHLAGVFMRDVVAREWPELLEWPLNQPQGVHRLFLAVKRRLTRGIFRLRHPTLVLSPSSPHPRSRHGDP
jgi:hypothetical protein